MRERFRRMPGAASLRDLLLEAGWRFPLAPVLSAREPVALLYHSVPRKGQPGAICGETFERQIRFLARHFDIVPAEDPSPRRAFGRRRVSITFDDGFRNNVEVAAPILRRYDAPATFFVCSRHAAEGEYLWISYFQALIRYFPERSFVFRETTFDMAGAGRAAAISKLWDTLAGLRPHPTAIYDAIRSELPPLEEFVPPGVLEDEFAGATEEHLRDLAAGGLFRIGVHTVDHPLLTRCEPEEARRQIVENRDWIERVTGAPSAGIAYPNGDYDDRVVEICREAGLARGFAVTPRRRPGDGFDLPRMGVYSPSRSVLGWKVQWGRLLRDLRLSVG